MKKALMVLAAFLLVAPLHAQEEPESAPELSALAAKTQALEKQYSVGFGALFTDGKDDQLQSPFLALHFHGFDIPGIPLELDVATGALMEIGKGTFEVTLDDVTVRVWSTERLRVGNVITGVDLLVLDTGDYEFDARVIAGYAFNVNFSAEVALLEDEKPISATIFYRF